MHNHLKFNLPDGYDEKQLISGLADYYGIKKERPARKSMVIYDTFDWRLFDKSLVLYASGNKLFLRKLFKNEIVHVTEITSPPVFIWDFSDSKLKEQLAPIIKMRALFKLVEVHSRSTPWCLLNQDEKTVVRLVYEEIRPSRGKNAPVLAVYLWLNPVKGYQKDSRNLTKRLKESGFAACKKEDIYFKALEAVEKQPGSYSSKLKIRLDPDMRSDEAAKIILRFLLQVMKINQNKIEKDLDTEFLHDFRVAIRRTRSALSQIKSVFPQETIGRFKKDFVFVGKLSNQLRDLDVYLLKEDTYKGMLPSGLRDDINPLFGYLRKKRSKALKKVISGLESKKFAQIMQDWESFLHEPQQNSPTASNADLPIIRLARKRIYQQYRSIVKSGNLILKKTEDEKLHALRIECKKLRYLMEFFSSLFARQTIDSLIEQLKKLQDNLGDFNDLCVQQDYLMDIAGEIPAIDPNSQKVLVAIGSLIGTLDRNKQIVKNAFAKTYTNFAAPPNKRLFQDLFASKTKAATA
ncbi:MAG: CHAD domain-containing protein [Desulfobacterales bacterium]|uniref:CHAD domain-containing protein n=1 Tax=Candidatus Desulfatibia vada TaxID=2841696 RepID=A0A8J6P0Z9_9BACT|nr:CHAD domain-containing protein [Candidatus Desulfatibia vada]MBL6970809.1 CHAD domain-containing protein [Desulfobacterales bacterium]